MWKVNVFTMFLEAFPGTLGVSFAKRALEQKKWSLNLIDLKKFSAKSGRIDSAPCGGGAGMILSPYVFEKAFDALAETEKNFNIFYMSPRGRQIKQSDFIKLSKLPGITVLCGRYEGVDQRIIDFYKIDEISIGDFVLLGGEVAAMAIIEGCVRLLPDVIGNTKSVNDDSFQNYLLEYHQYTKPAVFNGLSIPSVLLSGNHKNISKFRLEQSKKITLERRSDLWAKYISNKVKD